MIDTLRILVSYQCNLNCSYCCNNIPAIRAEIKPVELDEIDFTKYKVVCISGGEPLMFMDKVKEICERAKGKFVVLYTNGILLNPPKATDLNRWGVSAINIGMHKPSTFVLLIDRVRRAVGTLPIPVRFHLEDAYEELATAFPGVAFRFWHRDECERGNEDRVVLRG